MKRSTIQRMWNFYFTSIIFCIFLTLGLGAVAKADVIWDPASVVLESYKVGKGVYAVVPKGAAETNAKGYPVATSGGFVVGDDSVLVIESMITKTLASQLITLVKQVTDKPIRYVVNTSYHGDHSYGNYVFPQSTSIMQHPKTHDYITNPELFNNDKAFMMKYFGKNVGIEEVEARGADILVDDHKIISLGNRDVQIMHWGFAQTPGDLFVWVPDEKVFWTGNPVIAIPPALPWLLEGHHRESLATLKKVRRFLPEDATIVPGHGRPMKPNDIDFTIQYLETLDNRVRTALANNISLKEAQLSITMPDFQGYALFDWVHFQVNLPAVYYALSAQ